MLRKEQIARAFHLEAKTDLAMAGLAYENGIYSRSVSMSQQVVEKILKAALAMVGFYGLKKHEVLQYFVGEYSGIVAESLISKIANLARPIEDQWIRSRYPDWSDPNKPVWIPSEQYDQSGAEKALSGAGNVYKLIVDIMKSRFDFEL